MNDANSNLEREIAREAAIAYIPPRPGAPAPEAKTFANLADDAAKGIAGLLLAMDAGDKALNEIAMAASAMLEKESHARKVIAGVRAATQK